MKSYGKLALGIIATWFIVVLSTSALHLFRTDANHAGVAYAVAALAPVALFSVWFAASEKFQELVFSLNPRTLTAVQSWRIFGFLFLLLAANQALPAIFAVPAAYGDVFIGLTAALVAWKLATPEHRTFYIFWQGLGLTDLIMTIILGSTAPLLSPGGPSMNVMTQLPLPSSINTAVTRSAILRFCSALRPSTQVICTWGISLLLGIYDSPCLGLQDPSILSASRWHSFLSGRINRIAEQL